MFAPPLNTTECGGLAVLLVPQSGAPDCQKGTGATLPSPQEIWITLIDLDRDEHDIEILDAAEIQRAARLKNPLHARRFLAAHTGLRRQIGRCLDLAPEKLRFEKTVHGKPFLPKMPLHFNLTHSGSMGAVAIAANPIGVDIELQMDIRHLLETATFFLSAKEIKALASLPAITQRKKFFDLWTCKEALLKACGSGLNYDPRLLPFDALIQSSITYFDHRVHGIHYRTVSMENAKDQYSFAATLEFNR